MSGLVSASTPGYRRNLPETKGQSGALFFLDDDQWEAITIHLPVRQRGPKRLDDRLVISGILHVLQSGCAWRDCPREYGPYMTVFNRYLRWQKRGIWDAILHELLHNDRLPKLSLRIRPTQGATATRSFGYTTAGSGAVRSGDGFAQVRHLDGRDPAIRSMDGVSHDDAGSYRSAERTLATAELTALVRSLRGDSPESAVEKIVDWYLRKMESSRPGRADQVAPADGKLQLLISFLSNDYLAANSRLATALDCVAFYASGKSDGGALARRTLNGCGAQAETEGSQIGFKT